MSFRITLPGTVDPIDLFAFLYNLAGRTFITSPDVYAPSTGGSNLFSPGEYRESEGKEPTGTPTPYVSPKGEYVTPETILVFTSRLTPADYFAVESIGGEVVELVG